METMIHNLSEFLNLLNEYKAHFSKMHRTGGFIFRGMSDVSWSLLPGIFREYPEKQKSSTIAGASYSRKIYSAYECKHSIMRELDLLNINEKSIFPGLDGIRKYINKYYQNNVDDIIEYL